MIKIFSTGESLPTPFNLIHPWTGKLPEQFNTPNEYDEYINYSLPLTYKNGFFFRTLPAQMVISESHGQFYLSSSSLTDSINHCLTTEIDLLAFNIPSNINKVFHQESPTYESMVEYVQSHKLKGMIANNGRIVMYIDNIIDCAVEC